MVLRDRRGRGDREPPSRVEHRSRDRAAAVQRRAAGGTTAGGTSRAHAGRPRPPRPATPCVSRLAISGAATIPTTVTMPSASERRSPSSPDASRSASASSPGRSAARTWVRAPPTSAPAATSSNNTFETAFAAWNAFPRYVVPSTAAITSTRTNPKARDRAVTAPMRFGGPCPRREPQSLIGCVRPAPSSAWRREAVDDAPLAVAVVTDDAVGDAAATRAPPRPAPASGRDRRRWRRPRRACRRPHARDGLAPCRRRVAVLLLLLLDEHLA